jgi:hypothetical protein
MSSTKEYVDSLFQGYEQTKALADFKEELLSNLNAKIDSMVKKGLDQQAAFDKAAAELGDVSALADELSLKKRQEVFQEVYMDIRQYMKPARVAGYVAFGATFLFGIIVALIIWFSMGEWIDMAFPFLAYFDKLTGVFGSFMLFAVIAIAGFTFLGLTQETAAVYPMKKKRAIWYTIAAALISFGITTMPITYFATVFCDSSSGIMLAIAVLIPFVLPGGGILAFLILTEQSRLKPWMQERISEEIKQSQAMFSDPATATRFGLFSGAIWVFALALFILLGFLASFRVSWLVFVFATALQLVVQGCMFKRGSN